MSQQTRAQIEAIILGKRVSRIRWATEDAFGHPVGGDDSTSVDGLDFDDGSSLSVEGSGQIDIMEVWLSAEGPKR